MALDTYANLKTAITDWLDRDDLISKVDDFIDIAEARHKRDVRIREMLQREPITVVNRYVSLPFKYLGGKSFKLLTDPVTVLTSLTQHELDRTRIETTGKPVSFTVHQQIEMNRGPDIAYNGEIVYYRELSALSDTNTKNSLLTKAADVYLYGALAASAPFLMNDERVPLWETLYTNAKDAVNLLDQDKIGPLVSKVSGATP